MAGDGRKKGPLALVGRDEDVAFYLKQVGARPGPVLVLGCAQGRIAWAAASSGSQVLGVDPSEVMISAAESRRSSEPAEVSARVRLTVADLRSFRSREQFSTVIAPQNAVGLMGTLEELDALFATVSHHLAPEGAFLFDATHPRHQDLHAPDDGSHPTFVEPRRPLFAPHLRERRAPQKGPAPIRRLRVGQYRPAELDAALLRAGLQATERFGGFGTRPLEAGDALQVVVALSCRRR